MDATDPVKVAPVCPPRELAESLVARLSPSFVVNDGSIGPPLIGSRVLPPFGKVLAGIEV